MIADCQSRRGASLRSRKKGLGPWINLNASNAIAVQPVYHHESSRRWAPGFVPECLDPYGESAHSLGSDHLYCFGRIALDVHGDKTKTVAVVPEEENLIGHKGVRASDTLPVQRVKVKGSYGNRGSVLYSEHPASHDNIEKATKLSVASGDNDRVSRRIQGKLCFSVVFIPVSSEDNACHVSERQFNGFTRSRGDAVFQSAFGDPSFTCRQIMYGCD